MLAFVFTLFFILFFCDLRQMHTRLEYHLLLEGNDDTYSVHFAWTLDRIQPRQGLIDCAELYHPIKDVGYNTSHARKML